MMHWILQPSEEIRNIRMKPKVHVFFCSPELVRVLVIELLPGPAQQDRLWS